MAVEDADERRPAEPKPAATVVLMREGQGAELELYLLQRQPTMGFMGGMHVFPGGKVAAADGSTRMRARIAEIGPDTSWGPELDGAAALARAVAAVRETLEEAGVLLGADADAETCARVRAGLHAGDELGVLLEQAGLRLDLSCLQPLSRWITPDSEPTRFDTSFYLARLPPTQHAAHDGRESVGACWMSPGAALEASAQGQIRLAPPTARTLEGLAAAGSLDAAWARAAAAPLPVVAPVIRTLGGDLVLLYPGDPEHPQPTAVLPGPTRRVLRRR